MIPDIFHFVFGMAADFGGRSFGLPHYLAIRSAAEVNRPATIYFHYEFEPTGPWWEKTKPLVTLNKIKAPTEFMGRKLYHVAHQSDVVRLQALQQTGGVYLDADTISVKPLHEMFHHSCIIGQELKSAYLPKNWRQHYKYVVRNFLHLISRNKVNGLCNAVLLAEKGSAFIQLWLNTYGSFRSKGKDKYWNEHSVFMPIKLAQLYPELVTLLEPTAFHWPLYDDVGLQQLFTKKTDFPDAYVHHLWESISWDRYLSRLTVKDIMETDSTYNCIARKYVS